jgi:hypothetical protein
MVNSIRAMGIIRPVVVAKTDIIDGQMRKYLIDGQHLFEGCVREDLEVPYVEIEVTSELDLVYKMAKLNNSSKSWTLMDYVNAFLHYVPDYLTLKRYTRLYNLEPLMIASICANDSRYNGMHSGSKVIKSGNFEITNVKAEEMCKAFSDLFLKIGTADRWVKKEFLTVFMQAYQSDKYDQNTIMSNIDKHIKEIKVMSDTSYANQFIQKNVFNLI